MAQRLWQLREDRFRRLLAALDERELRQVLEAMNSLAGSAARVDAAVPSGKPVP